MFRTYLFRLATLLFFVLRYLPSPSRMYPALILSGRAIGKGKQLGHVHNLDVAPTIAYLLDLKLEATRGRILKEALSIP